MPNSMIPALYTQMIPAQEDIKLHKQLESSFIRTINWNKYLAKTANQAQNRYLDYLVDPSFQGVNRLFILSFKDNDGRESHKQYYLPVVEIKDYSIMINWRNLFDQPSKKWCKNMWQIWKISSGQEDDYTTGCLLDYPQK